MSIMIHREDNTKWGNELPILYCSECRKWREHYISSNGDAICAYDECNTINWKKIN